MTLTSIKGIRKFLKLTSAIWVCRSSNQTGSWSSKRTSFFSGGLPDLLGTWCEIHFDQIPGKSWYKRSRTCSNAYLMYVFISIHIKQVMTHGIICPFMNHRSNLNKKICRYINNNEKRPGWLIFINKINSKPGQQICPESVIHMSLSAEN